MARPVSKLSRFILSLPPGMPAPAVVRQAAALGLTTTTNNVYRVRRLLGPSTPGRGPAQLAPAREAALAAAIEALAHDFVTRLIRALRTTSVSEAAPVVLATRAPSRRKARAAPPEGASHRTRA